MVGSERSEPVKLGGLGSFGVNPPLKVFKILTFFGALWHIIDGKLNDMSGFKLSRLGLCFQKVTA